MVSTVGLNDFPFGPSPPSTSAGSQSMFTADSTMQHHQRHLQHQHHHMGFGVHHHDHMTANAGSGHYGSVMAIPDFSGFHDPRATSYHFLGSNPSTADQGFDGALAGVHFAGVSHAVLDPLDHSGAALAGSVVHVNVLEEASPGLSSNSNSPPLSFSAGTNSRTFFDDDLLSNSMDAEDSLQGHRQYGSTAGGDRYHHQHNHHLMGKTPSLGMSLDDFDGDLDDDDDLDLLDVVALDGVQTSGSGGDISPLSGPSSVGGLGENGTSQHLSVPGGGSRTSGPGGVKRKSKRAPSTAERRANHNAIERQRRESLNGRFLELAGVIPSMAHVKRPSKSIIVNKSLEYIQDFQSREKALSKENEKLKKEIEELKARLSLKGSSTEAQPGRYQSLSIWPFTTSNGAGETNKTEDPRTQARSQPGSPPNAAPSGTDLNQSNGEGGVRRTSSQTSLSSHSSRHGATATKTPPPGASPPAIVPSQATGSASTTKPMDPTSAYLASLASGLGPRSAAAAVALAHHQQQQHQAHLQRPSSQSQSQATSTSPVQSSAPIASPAVSSSTTLATSGATVSPSLLSNGNGNGYAAAVQQLSSNAFQQQRSFAAWQQAAVAAAAAAAVTGGVAGSLARPATSSSTSSSSSRPTTTAAMRLGSATPVAAGLSFSGHSFEPLYT